MIKLKFEIKIDSRKTEPNQRSPTYAVVVPQKSVNWGAIAVAGLAGLIVYSTYQGYQTIKPALDTIDSTKEWIEKIKNFRLKLPDWFDAKNDDNSSSLNYLEIGNPQPKKNQYVGGYRVTSRRGWRTHPVTGEKKSWHNGVDLATPVGTPTFAIAPGFNKCKNQPGGAGKYAEFTFAGGNWQARYFHLSSCTPGEFKAGEIIAKSGNTGRSTGPHSHIELRKKIEQGWETIDPSVAMLKYSFQPFSIEAKKEAKNRYDGTITATKGLNPRVAAFLDAIAYAEGTLRKDGYEVQYGYEKFYDFAKHPNKVICKQHNHKRLCSSAAGRYQFLSSTWEEVKQKDFSAESQDAGAIALLKKKGILSYVEKGQWATAIYKARFTWASFSGNNYGQKQMSLKDLLDFIESREEVYK